MADIRIEVDTSALEDALDVLGPAVGRRSVARAINRTVTFTRRKVLQELSRQIGLPQKRLAERVRVRRVRLGSATGPGRAGTSVRLSGSVRASGSDITLRAFGARKAGKGVSFSPGRGRGRTRVHHAFIAEMPSGHTGVFVRATGAASALVRDVEQVRRTRRVRRTRADSPIAKLLLPGVSQAMFDNALQATLQRDAEGRLADELAESVRLELGRATGVIPSGRRRRRRTASG